MKNLLTLLFCLAIIHLHAQENNQDSSIVKLNYDLDIAAGTYYQFSTFGSTSRNEARIPELLPRRINDLELRRRWDLDDELVSDIPSFHGSYFFKLGGQFQIGENLKITSSINAEQRGFSDGVVSRRTRNFYPYFNAAFSKQKGKFSYLIQAGDFWNLRLYEGLTFDNLETQSWIFKFMYGNFFFKHVGIGDLLIGIGLGIDDLYNYSTGFENLQLSSDKNMYLDFELGYSNNRGSLGGGFWNFSAQLDMHDKLSFYSQLSIDKESHSAFLIGLDNRLNFWNKFEMVSSIEFRSYSAGFNQGYRSTVYYRDPEGFADFTNSTHNAFIPLDFYERPFNQWAVFTEYQDLSVTGINIQSDMRYDVTDNFFLKAVLDFNWVFTESENFLYPFYRIGLGSRPIKSTEISLELTNRVLNLDKDYPTLYASQTAYFLLRLYKPLRFTRENDSLHRI